LPNPLPADDPPAPKADDFSPYVTKDGGITLPLDYREKFVHLGTYAVATKPDKPVDEMHNVYARPEDVQAYRRDGKFPDGAILVKDVTTVGSEQLTTGQSTWTKGIKIWFVMVKDSKGRFPKNDLWGDGWGWALWDGKSIVPAGNTNIGELNDPQVNKWFLQMEQASSQAQRNAITHQIDMQVMKDAVVLPAVYSKALLYRGPNLANVNVNSYYGMYDYGTLGAKG